MRGGGKPLSVQDDATTAHKLVKRYGRKNDTISIYRAPAERSPLGLIRVGGLSSDARPIPAVRASQPAVSGPQ